ncbi:ATP-binding cassette domain-containing protein [Salinimicrobium tongyeongense]|uniref:ATP-binding cassette domain-containing protein n=1 Tax=Salinimicrobium tongyeongense TaxID=2809707 RepID=UPI002236AE02|nr:ABC transporter ATP-binding protein [Salinimicrobium tongyeongense]
MGILDGFGLMMFLPLLQLVDGSSSVDSESLGNLQFLVTFMENNGISLTLLTVLSTMAFFFLAKGVIQYLSGIYKVNVQEWFIRNLRIRNIVGLNNIGYKYFVVSDVGRIQNTLTGEIDRVAGAYFNYTRAFESFILVVVYMAFAFYGDAQFAMIVSIGGILTNYLYKSLYKRTKEYSRGLTRENNQFQSLIIQNVGNYKYLKATGSLEKYAEKLKLAVLKIRNSQRKIGQLDAMLTAGREPLLVIIVVIAIYIQTYFLGAELAPILMSLFFFYRALNSLIQMQLRWNKFLGVSGSLENMLRFETEMRENKEISGKEPVKEVVDKIRLEGVWFYYGDTPVLKNVTLQINKHETIAFVGESGSGKTTLVNIVAGLLPASRGGILLIAWEVIG